MSAEHRSREILGHRIRPCDREALAARAQGAGSVPVNVIEGQTPEGPKKNRLASAARMALMIIQRTAHDIGYNRVFPYALVLGVAGLAVLFSEGNVAEALTITVASAAVGSGIKTEQRLNRQNS